MRFPFRLRRTLILSDCVSAKFCPARLFICDNCFKTLLKVTIIIYSTINITSSFAQTDSSHINNDTSSLQNVTVTAFSSQEKWKDVPASVAIVKKNSLLRYDKNSLLP